MTGHLLGAVSLIVYISQCVRAFLLATGCVFFQSFAPWQLSFHDTEGTNCRKNDLLNLATQYSFLF